MSDEFMGQIITLKINGTSVSVATGTTVAGAMMIAGVQHFRRSVSGETRGPLCGMGVCYECRVTINGEAQSKSCQILCGDGMEVMSGE
jgi:predicted molibdopterin-dependent oxidoreductase YjgC